MSWGSGTGYFTVSIDTSRKTLFDGDFQITGTCRNSWWRDPTEDELADDPSLYRKQEVETIPWTKVIHVKAIAIVTVTVEENRGISGPPTLPAGTLAGDKTISWSRNDGDFGVVASGSMVLKECNGSTITYSARRVNEADGWTITKTTTTISTTITAPDCTIS